MILPFLAFLLAIALMPLINARWWENHYSKIAAGLAAITVLYYVLALGQGARLVHVAHEYLSFIILIGSLFVVTGGIHIDVKTQARPWTNCAFLLIGAMLANLVGTTGASILLIRPWIRMNQSRISAYHIVFFIFIVSNAGGCLTPIGDPPLFLGYLKGVPFWWVLQKCWIAWAIVIGGLLAIFFAIDELNCCRNPSRARAASPTPQRWTVEGAHNFLFLALILVAVFLRHPAGVSESLMLAAAVGSWFTTPKQVHEANAFDFHPIREVTWLFLGIFATMVPALDLLKIHAPTLGMDSGMKLFWFTGILSSILDNAPTYLSFLAAAMGGYQASLDNPAHVANFAANHDHELMAISLASVFFGAMTYLGNGPNFMVKSIAAQAGVKIPGFFSYLLKYSLPILVPLLALVAFLFFSRWRIF